MPIVPTSTFMPIASTEAGQQTLGGFAGLGGGDQDQRSGLPRSGGDSRR